MRAVAVVDGRGNANTGARAAVITLEDGRVVEKAERLKPLTNNEAEYLAVILAIEEAIKLGVTHLSIKSDSQLVVRQLQGVYKSEKPHLAHLMAIAIRLAHQLGEIDIAWVSRIHTKRPDALCRQVDKPTSPRKNPLKRKTKKKKSKPLPIVDERPLSTAELLKKGY